jgi:hypothetical protein
MADDFGMSDVANSRMLDRNGSDFQFLSDGNRGNDDTSSMSGPSMMGFGLVRTAPYMLARPLLPGNINTQRECQAQVPRYVHGENSSSTFEINSADAPEFHSFSGCDLTTPNSFDIPMITANEALPKNDIQKFDILNSILGLEGSHHAAPAYSTTQDIEYSTPKKRKAAVIPESGEPPGNTRVFDGASVLKLIFKCNQDLTVTQMEYIAEETGYSVEYIFGSLLQYRRAAKSSLGKWDGRGEKTSGSLHNPEPEKWYHCEVSDCDMRFRRPGDLTRHSKKHRPGEHPCIFPECGKIFNRRDKLRDHWKKEHGDTSLPSDLSSSRPRKDHDQDGNSGSNGPSSNGPGHDGQSSDRSSECRKSDTWGSSTRGGISGGQYGFSRSTEAYSEIEVDKKLDLNSIIDRESEIGGDSNVDVESIIERESSIDMDSKLDVDSWTEMGLLGPMSQSTHAVERYDECNEEFIPEIGPGQEESSIAKSAMVTAEEAAIVLQYDQYIISLLEVQFPPPYIDWLKDFERNPDCSLKKSYRNGILQSEVDLSAPVVKIGITFMAGADKPSVTSAELSRVSDAQPFQKSPEWRVITAATLLKRLEIGDDLLIYEKDYSALTFQNLKQNERHIKSGKARRHDQASNQVEEAAQALERCNVQDRTLTIDSDEVKLIHGNVGFEHNFDITCTLIEIDMLSMGDLLVNYRTIVQGDGRKVSTKDVIAILDTMINDVRRLCCRSPRLFRMGTRSLIARSTDTRYGVDYGSHFATLMTSAGVRKLIQKSSAYYLSLNDSKTDQDYIRPKFLQMLVLLLSLLNDEDLKNISNVLESAFQLPADRPNLELLIMKVLPLASISSEVFLESLFDVYKPAEERKPSYAYSLQSKIWEELQQDLAEKGYIVPVPVESLISTGLTSNADEVAYDLGCELEALNLDGAENVPSVVRDQNRLASWRAPWPRDGVTMSTIFKYLQHDGLLREKVDSKRGTFRAMNDIPHLEITSEDQDNKLQALFTNKVQYRLSANDPDFISNMMEGQYVLTSLDKDMSSNLEITHAILNEPLIDATKELNLLVQNIKHYLVGRAQRQSARQQNSAPSVASFAPVEEPTEAKWLWAEIVSPTGERQRVAEVFKMGKKVVYRDDILRDMNISLSKLDKAVKRFEKELGKFTVSHVADKSSRRQQQEVEKCDKTIVIIKQLMNDAEKKRAELQTLRRQYPEDPITKVIYPSFAQSNGGKPEWQRYQTQLARDKERLIVKSKKLTVASVYGGQDCIIELGFANSGVKLSVEPLTSGGVSDNGSGLSKGDTILWMGYYVVLVKPVDCVNSVPVKGGQSVLGYFRVRSQKLKSYQNGGRSGERGLKDVISVLV